MRCRVRGFATHFNSKRSWTTRISPLAFAICILKCFFSYQVSSEGETVCFVCVRVAAHLIVLFEAYVVHLIVCDRRECCLLSISLCLSRSLSKRVCKSASDHTPRRRRPGSIWPFALQFRLPLFLF